MEVIFHEKQDGRLCAQHCLNAVLQGPYYSAVELSELANRLDDEERAQMAENGVDSDEYRQFLEQPSNNLDDTGYFSVQVISKALALWNLDLVNYSGSESQAQIARAEPCQMQAFICHHQNHWFCIRRFGVEWFNLNSLLSGPKYMSDTYLTEFLMELQTSGYTIFIVCGEFPHCEADKYIGESKDPTLRKLVQTKTEVQVTSKERIIPITIEDDHPSKHGAGTSNANYVPVVSVASHSEEEDDLLRAISLSLEATDNKPELANVEETTVDDDDLEAALKMSLECFSTPVTPEAVDSNEIRRLRLARFESGTNIIQNQK